MAPDPAPRQSGNPYQNPALFRWVDAMEGLPSWADAAETPEERTQRRGWRARGHQLFEMVGSLVPGVALAGTLALLGDGLLRGLGAALPGDEALPLSPILVAILLGLGIRNTVGVPSVYEVGLQLCLKRVLRIGVALLGIRLSLEAVAAIGLAALPVVCACIVTALVLVGAVGRAVGLPRRLGTLIAVGTAICGNTAIVATGPAIGADEDEISYAVGCITVFGLLALLLYPFLAHGLFGGDGELSGLFLGTAIHDTAQVAGAGLLYLQQFGDPAALDHATVTKLVRNLFMLAVIPLMAVLHHRGLAARGGRPRPPLRQMVPLFVFGFAALALLRTVGDLGPEPFGLLSEGAWQDAIRGISHASTACLTAAMASVGLGTNLRRLRSLGVRPLAVGLFAALLVGGMSALALHALRGLGLVG